MASRWGWQSNALFHNPMRVLTRASERRPPVVTLNQIRTWPHTFVAMQQAEEDSSSEASSMASGSEAAAAEPRSERLRNRGDTAERKGDEAMHDTDSGADDDLDDRQLSAAPFAPNAALNSKVRLFRGDVTNLAVDAVVNAANSRLVAGGGICGAIFDKADEWKLSKACKRSRQLHGPCPPGQARLTRGYSLPAPFVIHAVGPMDQDENDLAAAYWSTLDQCAHPQLDDAKEGEAISIRSVALCCISTGIYGFDNEDACQVALRTTRQWLEADPANADAVDAIVFVVFLQKDKDLYERWMPVFFPIDRKQVNEVKAKQREEEKARLLMQQQKKQEEAKMAEKKEAKSPEKKKSASSSPVKSQMSKSPQPKSSQSKSPAARRESQPQSAAAAAASSRSPQPSTTSSPVVRAAPSSASESASSDGHSAAAAASATLPSPSSLQLKKRKSEEETADATAQPAAPSDPSSGRSRSVVSTKAAKEHAAKVALFAPRQSGSPAPARSDAGTEQPAAAAAAAAVRVATNSPPHEIKRRKAADESSRGERKELAHGH